MLFILDGCHYRDFSPLYIVRFIFADYNSYAYQLNNKFLVLFAPVAKGFLKKNKRS